MGYDEDDAINEELMTSSNSITVDEGDEMEGMEDETSEVSPDTAEEYEDEYEDESDDYEEDSGEDPAPAGKTGGLLSGFPLGGILGIAGVALALIALLVGVTAWNRAGKASKKVSELEARINDEITSVVSAYIDDKLGDTMTQEQGKQLASYVSQELKKATEENAQKETTVEAETESVHKVEPVEPEKPADDAAAESLQMEAIKKAMQESLAAEEEKKKQEEKKTSDSNALLNMTTEELNARISSALKQYAQQNPNSGLTSADLQNLQKTLSASITSVQAEAKTIAQQAANAASAAQQAGNAANQANNNANNALNTAKNIESTANTNKSNIATNTKNIALLATNTDKELKEVLDALEGDYENYQATVKKINEIIAKTNEVIKIINAMQDELDKIDAVARSNYDPAVGTAASAIADWNTTIAPWSQTRTTLETMASELTSAQAQHPELDLSSTINDIQNTVGKTEMALSSGNAASSALASASTAYRASVTSGADSTGTLASLNSSISSMNACSESFARNLGLTEGLMIKYVKANDAILSDVLKSAVDELQSELEGIVDKKVAESEKVVKDYTDEKVLSERSSRVSADNALWQYIDSSESSLLAQLNKTSSDTTQSLEQLLIELQKKKDAATTDEERDALELQIQAVKKAIADADAALKTAQEDIISNQDKIIEQQQKVKDIQDQIDALDKNSATYAQDLAALQRQLDEANALINNYTSDIQVIVNDYKKRIGDMGNELSDKITANSEAIKNLLEALYGKGGSSLNPTDDSLFGKLNERTAGLQSEIDKLTTDLNTLKEIVDNIDTGDYRISIDADNNMILTPVNH